MGNIIKWSVPADCQTTYDVTEILRASSKTGAYNLVSTQSINDNSFFDFNGLNTDWYKVRFYDSTNEVYGDYSEPIQGGKFSGYCTIDDVRSASASLTSTVIKDSILFELIQYATANINQDILTEYRDEPVYHISTEKQNKIDGTNKTFFIKNPYFGDYTDDGLINEDDLYVYSIDSYGTKKEYSVSSIDDYRQGKFTLTNEVPNGEKLYLTYRSSPVLLYPSVNLNVRLAAIKFVLALAFGRTDPGLVKSYRINKISVTGESSPSKRYMQEYYELISKINSSSVKEKSSDYEPSLRRVLG